MFLIVVKKSKNIFGNWIEDTKICGAEFFEQFSIEQRYRIVNCHKHSGSRLFFKKPTKSNRAYEEIILLVYHTANFLQPVVCTKGCYRKSSR